MRKCRTPGLWFNFSVQGPNAVGQTHVQAGLTIPSNIVLSKEKALELEKAFHDAMEKHLAPLWKAESKS